MAGLRKSLIVANDQYEHEGLEQLMSPGADAEALASVLGDAEIGPDDIGRALWPIVSAGSGDQPNRPVM